MHRLDQHIVLDLRPEFSFRIKIQIAGVLEAFLAGKAEFHLNYFSDSFDGFVNLDFTFVVQLLIPIVNFCIIEDPFDSVT